METENHTSAHSLFAKTDAMQNADFWNNQYKANTTGWDLGQVSPPLKRYIDQLTDKNQRILIPGCGNTYEAEYLLQHGFNNITLIDIAPILVERLKIKFAFNPAIKIVLGNFFTHNGEYDLVLEQTFFCALDTSLRLSYVAKMKELLAVNGKLVGVFFNKLFEQNGPPFGGVKQEYIHLFKDDFHFKVVDECYNSFIKRKDSELFIILQKRGTD